MPRLLLARHNSIHDLRSLYFNHQNHVYIATGITITAGPGISVTSSGKLNWPASCRLQAFMDEWEFFHFSNTFSPVNSPYNPKKAITTAPMIAPTTPVIIGMITFHAILLGSFSFGTSCSGTVRLSTIRFRVPLSAAS